MKLSALFDNAPDIEIENLMVDSRDVLPNSIFFCIKGMIHDGHRYVNAAVKNGAVCVVHSEDIKLQQRECRLHQGARRHRRTQSGRGLLLWLSVKEDGGLRRDRY